MFIENILDEDIDTLPPSLMVSSPSHGREARQGSALSSLYLTALHISLTESSAGFGLVTQTGLYLFDKSGIQKILMTLILLSFCHVNTF